VDKYKDRVEAERREIYLTMAANNLWGCGTNMTFDEAEEWLLANGWDDISTKRQLEILNEVNEEVNH
jgi:hypothetical protein